VQWVLNHPNLTRKRFSDLQWAVLRARNPRCECGCGSFNEGQNSSRAVNEMIRDADGNTYTNRSALTRQAEAAAMLKVGEIMLWFKAHEKWTRIRSGHPRAVNGEPETLDKYERDVLDKFRKARPVKGRQSVEFDGWTVHEDLLNGWFDRSGKFHPRATRFRDLSPSERRQHGIPELFGED
jgi:hypothetical protein